MTEGRMISKRRIVKVIRMVYKAEKYTEKSYKNVTSVTCKAVASLF